MALPFREPMQLVRTTARNALRLAGLTLPILFGLGVGRFAAPYLPEFSAWVHTLGPWAPVAFVAAYVLVVVCMLPAFLMTMAGGAVFGVTQGSLLVLTGATLGGSVAFLLGRTVLRQWVGRRLKEHPTLSTIDRVVGEDGLRLMFLLRLSPAVPFVFSNYALGATSVRLRDFVIAMLGMLPVIGSYAALGYAGARGAGSDDSLPPGSWPLGSPPPCSWGFCSPGSPNGRCGRPRPRGPRPYRALPSLPGTARTTNSALFHGVAHIEEDLEVQLLATIGEIERRHLRRITRRLGTLEGFAVHLFKVAQDPLTGTRHTKGLEGIEGQAGRGIVSRLDTLLGVEEPCQLLQHHAPAAIRKFHR